MQLMADFEYKGDSAKTKANRIENFFTVGDLGEMDEDGYLFLRDRKADMIISGGANIYPAEIEGELINHPAVQDVAVFGIPNADWGEEIKAVVELHEGFEPGDELAAEIIAWAGDPHGQVQAAQDRSTSSTPSPASPTASSSSASSATRTGKASTARSDAVRAPSVERQGDRSDDGCRNVGPLIGGPILRM